MFKYRRLGGRGLLLVWGWAVLGLAPLHAGRVLIDFGTTARPTAGSDAAGRHRNPAAQPVDAARGFSKLDLIGDVGKSGDLASNNNCKSLDTLCGVQMDAESKAVVRYRIADEPNAHLSVLQIPWAGVAWTQPGQFAAARRLAPPPPPPSPQKLALAPVMRVPKPGPTVPRAPRVQAPAQARPNPKATAPVSVGPGKGMLYAGIILVVLGIILAGISAFKLFNGKQT